MSRFACFTCAALVLGSALALSAGCGGGGGNDVSNEVQVFVRNSYVGHVITAFDMAPAGSSEARVNLLSQPVPAGATRFLTSVPPGHYDWSAILEVEGGGMALAFNRIEEPILDVNEAKVIVLEP